MSLPIVELTSLDALERAIAESSDQPVVLFKHSYTCGTSAMAHEEMLDLLAAGDVPAKVYVVHVRAQRAVSDAIAKRFGLRHESPQVLLLRDGKVVWSASHFRVTADAVARQIEAHREAMRQ